jgi:Thiamine pyrophosphate enzyme, N-terminal TPP binding domain/Bacterial regulatory helix-turn-helix protein, lysR family
MGQAYSRLLQKPSVCMAASGPGVINLTTGIANALIDCCPVVAVGGSSPIGLNGSQSALSHTIRGLEARLGLRLLARTTRSVAPSVRKISLKVRNRLSVYPQVSGGCGSGPTGVF